MIRSRRRYRRPDRGRVGSRERRRERWTSEQARTRFGSSAGVWAGNRAADGFANNASHGTARSAPPVNATVGNEMKKRILQSLSILCVNIVLGGLALASFFLFVFRGDPILAAVPAVLALPGIILQPWFIAFFFLPGGPLLAPFLTTVVSVPVYVMLERNGKLERAKLVLAR